MRLSNEVGTVVVKMACQHLYDKFLYERSLFLSPPPSFTQVKALLAQMAGGNTHKIREEMDPHVIVGMVLFALKTMPTAPLGEVHLQFMETGDLASRTPSCPPTAHPH